jgi:CRP/FNR family cyclic AMP-dependent transcriptional regulator
MLRNHDPKMKSLSRIGVLSGATAHQLQEICRLTTELRIPADRILCRQGDDAREVFLVAEGQVAVSRADEPIGVVHSGGIIGEMAVLDRQPRTATTMALTDVTVFVLSTGEFSRLLADYPVVAANVRALVDARAEENQALRAA